MRNEVCLSSQNNSALVGGFDRYLNYVYSLPILSEQEERELLDEYHNENDLEAVGKLVLSHLRFVAYVAKGYRGYGLPAEDLVQEGTIGLMKSVKRFDSSYGVRLATYAVHWIKAEIQEYVLKNWQLVKVATTKAQRKLFFNLRSLKKKLGWMNTEEVNEVAEYLDVTPDDVRQMELRMSGEESSIEDSFREGDVDEVIQHETQQRTLCHEILGKNPQSQVEEEQFQNRCIQKVVEVMASLDERSRYIVENRWLVSENEKLGLKSLSEKFEVSMERIRQIESKALNKIKKQLIKAGITYVT
ncbi:MAG: RNA polymerase sigma factor RpoH [Oceanospirillaceae bacterium]|nr:RNA polymerase sigma factor RpoH [Oceanospirillaceae bacterium]